MNRLKDHPFAVNALFKESLVLTLACPREHVQDFIPECLELDTFQARWAFIAVAMVQTSALRPRGFPAWLGSAFFLIGYRVFVRYKNRAGKRLRGLYILRSETDSRRMQFFGNLFTHYKYTTTDVQIRSIGPTNSICSARSGLQVTYRPDGQDVVLPAGSPFQDWQEARRFAGPLPHTFTYNKSEGTVLTILGLRQHWDPSPVAILEFHSRYIDGLAIPGLVVASAFRVAMVPYCWEKGRKEQWIPSGETAKA